MTNIITGLLISITATNFKPKHVIKSLPERADGIGDVYFEMAPISTNVCVVFNYTNSIGKVVTWKHEVDFIESTNWVSRYRTNQSQTFGFSVPMPSPLPGSTTIIQNGPPIP